MREFWLEKWFHLHWDQANLGILETDWAENRAKLPQDFIRSTIGQADRFLYSTGGDKFRTRLERNANGGTDIFISHRGAVGCTPTSRGPAPSGSPARRPRTGN